MEEVGNEDVMDEFDNDNLRVGNGPTEMNIEDEINISEFSSSKKIPGHLKQQNLKDQG